MKQLLTLLLCLVGMSASAQRISHDFHNVSLSDALQYVQQQTTHYDIVFIYNELEDFRVTTNVRSKSVPDAILQLVGFYPVRVYKSGEREIYVECTHKTDRHLTGTIVDEQGQPVSYANVAVLNPADSTILSGGVSNESGFFAIPYEQPTVLARISYVGYKTIYKLCHQPEVGTIRLQPETYVVNGVTVEGSRPLVRMHDDAFVTTVEGSYLQKMGTGTDVLGHIPGVLRNGGSIEVIGRGAPLIYINGRPMHNGEELAQLSSDQIKDVEVVMTPGAKYDATVKAVIRIRTIRPVGEGLSFNNTLMVGVNHKLFGQEEINLNYRKGGLDVFSMVDYEDFSMRNTNISQQDTHLPSLYLQQQGRTEYHNNAKIKMGKLGFNYMLSDTRSFGITYTVAARPLRGDNDFITNTFENLIEDDQLTGNSHEETRNRQHIVNGYYSSQSDQWTVDVNADVVLQSQDVDAYTLEQATLSYDRTVTTHSDNCNHLYAAKLVAAVVAMEGQRGTGHRGLLRTPHRPV